jgi:dCMP deaminase
MLGPRKEFLCWDDAFMAIAKIMANRSKDPNTQVGACIVDKFNHIVGTGYNGFPQSIDNDKLPWDRDGKPINTKYLFVGHAEENAIDNSDKSRIYQSRIYVTLFPCNACAIRIINNRIKEVIYLKDTYHDSDSCKAARKMFKLAGVTTRQFKPEIKEVLIDLRC